VKLFILSTLLVSSTAILSGSQQSTSTVIGIDSTTVTSPLSNEHLHAIHLTASAAGSKKYRRKLDRMFQDTVINAVVVDIKEETGWVYVPGVKAAVRAKAYEAAIPDLAEWLKSLKERGIYSVARIVVFKDNIGPRRETRAAVHNQQGDLWFDRHHGTWFDPYNADAHTYNLLIALECAKIGFNEVQFDYIRFPTDGSLVLMRFSKPFNRKTSSEALVEFLRKARQLLHPMGVKISIDVFGLTTSVNTGMGIGQMLAPMAEQVDFVCPMVYPSHYNPGEYGIAIPNDNPYRVIFNAMRDAKKVLGADGAQKLRPYLQDFSLKGRGIRYGVKQVRDQMQAAADQGILNWTLWNARCAYTWDALRTPVYPALSSSTSTTTSSSSNTVPSGSVTVSSTDEKSTK
jgi:hypothetical protein